MMRSNLIISGSCILGVIEVGERDRHQHECLPFKDADHADQCWPLMLMRLQEELEKGEKHRHIARSSAMLTRLDFTQS